MEPVGRSSTSASLEQPRVAVLPDTVDTRLLVDLTSHASDLSEASHTLALAFEAGEESPLWVPLTSHAVTAYIRPFILSKVRARLDEMPEIPALPASLKPIHDLVRKYRNTTVAHSQSDLTTPVPLAILTGSGHPKDVIGVTMIQPMPRTIAEQFRSLISMMENVVDEAIEPVRLRLRAWLMEQGADDIAHWELPELVCAADTDFTAGRKRKRTHRYSSYWHVASPAGGYHPDWEQVDDPRP